MAHGGQELALGQHRRFGRLLGLQQLMFQLALALGGAPQLVALADQGDAVALQCRQRVTARTQSQAQYQQGDDGQGQHRQQRDRW